MVMVMTGIQMGRDHHLIPVSYTHLDVYKRQVQYIGHATFRRTAFQAAQQRVLPAEILQSAFQAGIEGVDLSLIHI